MTGATLSEKSRRNAATSRMQDSPERTPALNVFDPKGPTWSLGLFGANASSSMGLKTAIVYLFEPLNK